MATERELLSKAPSGFAIFASSAVQALDGITQRAPQRMRAIVQVRARSFTTEVVQDDADVGDLFKLGAYQSKNKLDRGITLL